MFRVFSPWILGTCLISVNLLLVLIAALVGWLPAILGFLHRTFRSLLILSYRLFSYLISLLNPYAERVFGLSLSSGTPRFLATTALSVFLVAAILLLTPLEFSWWTMGLAALHGLVVGVVWADALEPGGLHLGSRLQ